MTLLSIVIVNYNTRDDLRLCLDSLRNSDYPAEVIVVDNASQDGSVDMVQQFYPEVMLIQPGHNTWFCGGNNLGAAAAQGDYILFLNPDTIVQPDAVGHMMTFLTAHPEYAGATIQLRYPDGAIQRTCSRMATYEYLLFSHSILGLLLPGARRSAEDAHYYAAWERKSDFDVEAVPGSCTLLRRADGYMDADLLLYFPEDELARRCSGRKFRFLASSYITHREKSITKSWRATALYYRDLLVFTRKTFGWPLMAFLWLLSRPLYWAMALRWRLRPPAAAAFRREM